MASWGIVLGFLFGLAGGFLAAFMSPWAVGTGYRKASATYLVEGIVLLACAWGMGLSLPVVLALVGVWLAAFGWLVLFTLPWSRRVPQQAPASDVATIDDVVAAFRASGQQGWELVAAVQRLVAARFTYCRRNGWDSPARAFERGLGYCQQQALALHAIYRGLGLDSRPVYATKCRFPKPPDRGDSLALVLENRWLRAWLKGQEYVLGHSWVRVRIGDEERDVCPGDLNNRPGVIHFEPLLKVKTLHPLLQPFTHLGSAIVNVILERQAVAAGLRDLQGG